MSDRTDRARQDDAVPPGEVLPGGGQPVDVPPGPFRYRPEILAVVWRHGILPTSRTPPALARGFVRELYKFEIRRLRERYLAREFAKREYAGRVDALRRSYGVLAYVDHDWLVDGDGDGHVAGAAAGDAGTR